MRRHDLPAWRDRRHGRALDRARRGDRPLGLLRRRLLLRQGEPTARSRVTFTDPFAHDAVGTPLGVPLHPTQIYLSLNAFLIFLILQWAYRRKTFDGEVFWLYVLLYAITRGIVEIWRGDLVRGFVIPGVLSTSQFIGLLTALLALAACSSSSRAGSAPRSSRTVPPMLRALPGRGPVGRNPARPLPRRRLLGSLALAHPEADRRRARSGSAATPAKRSHVVRAGEEVVRSRSPSRARRVLEAEDIPLSILYEDEHLLAIDKPAGPRRPSRARPRLRDPGQRAAPPRPRSRGNRRRAPARHRAPAGPRHLGRASRGQDRPRAPDALAPDAPALACARNTSRSSPACPRSARARSPSRSGAIRGTASG